MIMNIMPTLAFSIVALFYLLFFVGSVVLLIWGFVTLLRIQKNTRETSAHLHRVIQLLEQQSQKTEEHPSTHQ